MLFTNKTLFVFAIPDEAGSYFDNKNVIFTGVGKINATYAITNAIHSSKPDKIVNFGTAGSKVFNAGSLVHCNQFIQRDMDLTALGYEKYKIFGESIPARLEYGEIISHNMLSYGGVLGSGDSFDITDTTDLTSLPYNLVDMEGYAIAKIAMMEQIPLLCVKFISDGADSKAAIDWNKTTKFASKAFYNFFIDLL